jgi:hypothetical protein
MMMAVMAAFFSSLWILARLANAVSDRWSSRHSSPPIRFYALTDRRAILWSPYYPVTNIQVNSLRRGQVDHVQRTERSDGLWDVELRVNISNSHWPSSFVGIAPDPRVESLARALLVTRPQPIPDALEPEPPHP